MNAEKKLTLDFVTSGALRAWRIEKGLSQVDLAEEIDVAQTALSAWETGSRCPSSRNLGRIERAVRRLS